MLVLFYIIHIVFSFTPHNHHQDVNEYSKASSCEKTMYYCDHISGCTHQSHLSLTQIDCPLCHTHTLPKYILHDIVFEYTPWITRPSVSKQHQFTSIHCPSNLTNKGPPTV